MMDYDGFLQLVQKQRSIRVFKPDPLPNEYIDNILEAARFAPSGANSQPWEIVVVKDKKIKDQIVEIVREESISSYKLGQTRPPEEQHPSDNRRHAHLGFQKAPVFFLLFSDPRLEDAYPMAAQAYDGHGVTVSSMANLFMYMHLAATSLGLASQWVSATAHPLPQALIKQLLGVPRSFILYDTMIAGYPDQSPPPRLVRTKEEFTHFDHYDRSKHRTDTQVREFINTIHKGRVAAAD
jgi:nitroreductase